VALYGGRSQSEGETLDYLLAIHFPNSLDIEREALPAAPNVWTGGWLRGLSLMGKCYGRLIRLPHTKVLVWRDIFGSATRRAEGSYPLHGQDFSCLPGD